MCGDSSCGISSPTSSNDVATAKIEFVGFTLSLANRTHYSIGRFDDDAKVGMWYGGPGNLLEVSGICAMTSTAVPGRGTHCLQVGGLSSTANECLQNLPGYRPAVQHFYAVSEYTTCSRLEYEVRPS